MNYVFWHRRGVPHGCRLQAMEGYGDTWKLHDGTSLRGEVPADASFAMNPNFPDNTLTPDYLMNIDDVALVSTRLKALLESWRLPDVEYLDVKVLDHKGKSLKPPYFIVNPTGTFPILELDACGAEMDELDESMIISMKSFAVAEDALAKAPPLFRARHIPSFLLMRRDLAKAIEANGFTGSRWLEPTALATGEIVRLLSDLPKDAEAKL